MVRISSDPELVGRNFAFRRYLQEAVQGQSYVTGLTVGAVGGAAGMVFAEPVRGEDEKVIGVLALRIRGSSVATILDEVRNDSALTPFLIDGDGVVVHHIQEELLYHSLTPLSAQKQAELRADQRFRRDRIVSLDQPALAAAMVGAQRTGTVSYSSRSSGEEEIAGYAPVTALDWVGRAVPQPVLEHGARRSVVHRPGAAFRAQHRAAD
jgi:C4-dicarboxylate-specific signal transduction histidine kinase